MNKKQKDTTHIIRGKLEEDEYGENSSALFVSGSRKPIAKQLESILSWYKRKVSVRYWISEEERTLEQLEENQVMQVMGDAKARYGDRYSDLTGYLWTDEELNIGGHNLLKEFRSGLGKWLYLEITVHN